MSRKVLKRDGSVTEFDSNKLNRWADWASQNCGVSWSDVVLEASRSLPDFVSTNDIQKTLIEVCVNRTDTGHSRMAARLLVGQIYKEAFDDFSIPDVEEFYNTMVSLGFWDDMGYSSEELQQIESFIDHTLDFTYEYCTIRQFYDKYAISSVGECLESPQMAIIGAAMSNVQHEDNRVQAVKNAYEELSKLKINLPTPSLAGQRTPQSGSPSCCVITGGDSVDSIEAAVHVAYKMTALSSGIGAELCTRSPKDPVKQGTIEHQGKMHYYRYLDRAVKANKQSTRGGSATVTYSVFDPEIETLLRLKSQRVTPDTRIDSMDYSLALTNFFLRKAAKDEPWMLVSSYFAPKLYELQYNADITNLEEEYNRVLADQTIKKFIVPARDVLNLYFTQRGDTGRIYKTNLTNVNKHTPFKEAVRISNLCQEVLLPTSYLKDTESLYVPTSESDGEVALCFLASIVAGRMPISPNGHFCHEAYYKTAYETCKFVDNTIEQSTYPFALVEKTAKARRSIGVGLTDVAHYMARHGLKYDSVEGRNALHRLAELHSYSLHRASVQLAKERGKCEWFHKTKYSDDTPWLPIDTYAKDVDQYHTQALMCDWEGLRRDIKKYGVRFSVHEAFMPVESSSLFTASTNSLYPIRDKKIFKKSPKGTVYFEAPGIEEFGGNYQSAYDISTKDLIVVYAIFQKFAGQGISADFYQKLTDGNKVSMKEQYENMFFSAKLGLKTWYYLNSLTNSVEDSDKAVEKEDKESCDNCTL